MKLTDNEIKKALECCIKAKTESDCTEYGCPYYLERDCLKKNGVDILDLIDRQQAKYEDLQEQFRHLDIECERLEKANESQRAEIERLKSLERNVYETVEKLKNKIETEARKEFAEKLKDIGKQEGAYDYVSLWDIDNLLKEMERENDK